MIASRNSRAVVSVVCLCLAAITWIVFAKTLSHGFVDYDDARYVFENPNVARGLSIQGIGWAFTYVHSANWHPLTWISHMIDCQIFGLKAGGHHFTNVLLHTIATLLLFLVFRQMTGALWRCAFVAALFAIHPLHVESVAWIAERKDVLSGVFFMLTLGAYARYARSPSTARYVLMSILFVCGLMSKPSLVTLPFVLLLLDYWPLRRLVDLTATRTCVIEKIPLLCLSALSSVMTLFAQQTAFNPIAELPITSRVANAIVSYATYLWQMICPVRLALFYPENTAGIGSAETICALILLLGITAAVWMLRSRKPYLVSGWFWYLGMLMPMIGLIQVGSQSHADRYTYLPEIGMYFAIAWGVADLVVQWRARREILWVASSLVIVALTVRAWAQTSFWEDNELLWRRTLAITSDNHTAENNLALVLLGRGKMNEGISHLEKAIAIDPTDLDAQFNLANALSQFERQDEAIAKYETILRTQPGRTDVETNLANVLLEKNRADEALAHYENVLREETRSAMAQYNLAVALHRAGRLSDAIAHYKETLALDPNYPDAERNLAGALLQNGQRDEAKTHLEKK